MVQTVLITGASTGIGEATARLFQAQGWNVAATMRSPENHPTLAQLPRVICPRLDVTEGESIAGAIAQTLETFGRIDVVVNNAGYGLVGAFEAIDPAQIQKQFDTNVFGLMAVVRAVLPQMRAQRSGTILNVTSIGGKMAFPLYSVYHATKWGVEGFSESLQYELAPFNIQVKIIEPGLIKTDFYGRSEELVRKSALTAYDAFLDKVVPNLKKSGALGSTPEATAKVIYRAATDGKTRLRYPAAGYAGLLLFLRQFSRDRAWSAGVRALTMRSNRRPGA